MAVAAVSRAFTVEEYERMAEAGVFGPEERVELIDGEVVQMNPIAAEALPDLAVDLAPLLS